MLIRDYTKSDLDALGSQIGLSRRNYFGVLHESDKNYRGRILCKIIVDCGIIECRMRKSQDGRYLPALRLYDQDGSSGNIPKIGFELIVGSSGNDAAFEDLKRTFVEYASIRRALFLCLRKRIGESGTLEVLQLLDEASASNDVQKRTPKMDKALSLVAGAKRESV